MMKWLFVLMAVSRSCSAELEDPQALCYKPLTYMEFDTEIDCDGKRRDFLEYLANGSIDSQELFPLCLPTPDDTD